MVLEASVAKGYILCQLYTLQENHSADCCILEQGHAIWSLEPYTPFQIQLLLCHEALEETELLT